jgi:hypothetical protein
MKRRSRTHARLSLIERAMIEKQWHATAVSAQIHALIGDDSREMVNKAGRVMYVALGAAIAEELDPDMPEIRILRGACNAVYDQAGEPEIPAARRASIVSGLEACERLIPALERKSLIDAACELALKMRGAHVHWSDFQHLLDAVVAA